MGNNYEDQSHDALIKTATEKIRLLLEDCKANYPNICALRSIPHGEDKAIRSILDILSKQPMSIESAIAQYEVSLS